MSANPLLVKVAMLIRDLLCIDEPSIVIGRENFTQVDFKRDYVTVDQLGGSNTESTSEDYDGAGEVMHYSQVFKTAVTVEFYGENAYANADRLVGLLRSQHSFEKKSALGLGVFNVSSLQDLKQLTGQQYGNRLQMTFIAQDCRTVDVQATRIDTAQFTVKEETTP